MSSTPGRKIVILGGGTAGWMAANLFANKWSAEQVTVSLIESPDIGIIGVGEGSTPTLKRFFQMLGIEEKEWMPRCNATYKVSIRFAGWSPASGIESYRHPFQSQLDSFTQNHFVMNCLNRRHGLNVRSQPDDFFLNGVLAQQGKGPLTPANFPFRMEYGYHFDSGLLGKYLAGRAVEQGVEHIQTRIVDAEQAANGDIAALVNDAGEKIEADFFVDCSGFASLLMQQTLGVKFKSFKANLFNDAAVVMPTPAEADTPVETLSHALANGWCWKIPLTNRIGNGYVYCSDFIGADAAETELRTVLGTLDSEEPARHLKMKVGQLENHWHRNCLALGLSQGFIEPLEATALHLVQISIELFISKYEQGNFTGSTRDEFNNKITERFERVRDYIVAHYKLNTRDDSDYWKASRENMALSDSLLRILDTWYRRGDVSREIERQKIESHFNSLSWHCLLSGYGAYPPLVEQQPDKVDFYKDHKVEQFLCGCSLNFKSHEECLAVV